MMTHQDNQLNIFGDDANDAKTELQHDEPDKSTDSVEVISEENNINNTKDEMSYEEAVAMLEQVVARLESGDVALDESMELFQQGMKLADFCGKKLNSMEEKITKLMLQADGTVSEMPFEESENGKV